MSERSMSPDNSIAMIPEVATSAWNHRGLR
jgi:hypothetical protein